MRALLRPARRSFSSAQPAVGCSGASGEAPCVPEATPSLWHTAHALQPRKQHAGCASGDCAVMRTCWTSISLIATCAHKPVLVTPLPCPSCTLAGTHRWLPQHGHARVYIPRNFTRTTGVAGAGAHSAATPHTAHASDTYTLGSSCRLPPTLTSLPVARSSAATTLPYASSPSSRRQM